MDGGSGRMIGVDESILRVGLLVGSRCVDVAKALWIETLPAPEVSACGERNKNDW